MHVVTQPYRRPKNAAEDNFLVTLEQEFDLLSAVRNSGKSIDLTDFLTAHPSGRAKIWAVGISKPALRAWEKIEIGDLVLFYGDGAVYAYGSISSKVHWPQNDQVWPSGSDWDHVYSLSEFVTLPLGQELEYESLRNLTDKLDVRSVGCRDLSSFGVSREELIRFITTDGPRHGRNNVPTYGIPQGITADDVKSALAKLATGGIPSGFGERTDWVLDDEGVWYPPKAVIGVAASRVLGRILQASEFSGGDGSGQANRRLRDLGFTVLRRDGNGIQKDPIKAWVEGLQSTRRATTNGEIAPHQPTTILWLLSEFLKGKPRLQNWSKIREPLSSLIVEAGGGPTPEYPLAVLANESLIDVQGIELPLPSTSSHPRRTFDQQDPVFGLTINLYDELGSQPDRIVEVINSVGSMFASDNAFQSVLTKLALPTPSNTSSVDLVVPVGEIAPGRKARMAYSVQRSAEVAKWVKQTYNDTCQVCRVRLETPGNATSDAAHIKGLGSPHDGPDIIENILCLCPNHHRTFDAGAWTITDDLKVKDLISGEIGVDLYVHDSHKIQIDCVQHHRQFFASSSSS